MLMCQLLGLLVFEIQLFLISTLVDDVSAALVVGV
jgi:hypothetical protein